MYANNEIGTIQPIAELAQVAETMVCDFTLMLFRQWGKFLLIQ